jgi:hypothetical protein
MTREKSLYKREQRKSLFGRGFGAIPAAAIQSLEKTTLMQPRED